MEDWQQRVLDERRELDERLVKLLSFLVNKSFGVSKADVDLLCDQRDIMIEYRDVLDARIARFLPPVAPAA